MSEASPRGADPEEERAPTEAERESAYQDEVNAHLWRNYSAHLSHGLLGQTGFRLINAPTFIPAYLYLLSGSDLVVGLARGLQAFGMSLSPILSATLIEHRRRVLPVGFVIGALMRVQVLGIALAGFFLPPEWNLRAICLFLGLFGFFLGMQGVVFNYLMSKVIPVERRGRLMGLRNTLAGVTAAAVAGFAGDLVDAEALGNGYAATFLLSFVLTAAGLSMLTLVKEPQPPEVRAPGRFRDRLRDLPELLRSDRAFTLYFVCRALATMGRMAVPFYVLYAGQQIEMSGEVLGQLTQVFILAWTGTNLLWGFLADRSGFRRVFLGALVLWILSSWVLMNAQSYPVMLCVFTGLGAGLGGFQMSAQNLVLEFGRRQDLPMRIAVANSASELVGAVGPILGGVLAAALGYPAVFWTAIAFKSAAVLLVAWRVPDPRHANAR
ncbi:MAG: MFS transporter [Myxococcota bacterium]